jgi:hypothetical protein
MTRHDTTQLTHPHNLIHFYQCEKHIHTARLSRSDAQIRIITVLPLDIDSPPLLLFIVMYSSPGRDFHSFITPFNWLRLPYNFATASRRLCYGFATVVRIRSQTEQECMNIFISDTEKHIRHSTHTTQHTHNKVVKVQGRYCDCSTLYSCEMGRFNVRVPRITRGYQT